MRKYIADTMDNFMFIFNWALYLSVVFFAAGIYTHNSYLVVVSIPLFVGAIVITSLAAVSLFFTEQHWLIAWVCLLPAGVLFFVFAVLVDFFYFLGNNFIKGYEAQNFLQWRAAGNPSFGTMAIMFLVAIVVALFLEYSRLLDRRHYRHRHGK